MKSKELIFRLPDYDSASHELQELFLIRMINNFVYKNKWYIGGDFVIGDLSNKSSIISMKEKLINYLKLQKTLKINIVIIQELSKDEFIDREIINL